MQSLRTVCRLPRSSLSPRARRQQCEQRGVQRDAGRRKIHELDGASRTDTRAKYIAARSNPSGQREDRQSTTSRAIRTTAAPGRHVHVSVGRCQEGLSRLGGADGGAPLDRSDTPRERVGCAQVRAAVAI